MNKKNIFICSTEQSGENISFNILSRLDLQNINVDGVSGERSAKYLNKTITSKFTIARATNPFLFLTSSLLIKLER